MSVSNMYIQIIEAINTINNNKCIHVQYVQTCIYHTVCVFYVQGADVFTSSVNIEVSRASKSAIEAVERNGGIITTAYYNKLGLRALLKPEKFRDRCLPRRALPGKKMMRYYLNPDNRGYLLTREGQQRLIVSHLLYPVGTITNGSYQITTCSSTVLLILSNPLY